MTTIQIIGIVLGALCGTGALADMVWGVLPNEVQPYRSKILKILTAIGIQWAKKLDER